jgi:transposase
MFSRWGCACSYDGVTVAADAGFFSATAEIANRTSTQSEQLLESMNEILKEKGATQSSRMTAARTIERRKRRSG